jgi:NADPH-dependent 2,4-dienoyl-CoA reductase/sulfur reductase-like enzyme
MSQVFCGIGVCFGCLATIDGTNQRTCLAPPEADPGEFTERHDVAVIGAGPAGLAAAATAIRAGLDVVLLDAGPRPGGQYWRHRDTMPAGLARLWSTVEPAHRPDTPVWFAEKGFRLHTPRGVVTADRLVIATGAYDRALPFPGWDRPGVVTAGGAQALLKGSGVLVGTRVVVAGAGPFLLPVAAGLAKAGARVVGVYEAGHPLRYLAHAGAAVRKLPEAARYAARLARYRVPYHPRHAVVAAQGDPVSTVEVARWDGRGARRRVDCDAVAVGWGFTPQLELPLALGCETRLDVDGSLVVTVDAAGATSVPGVYAAGEVTGVGGADLAVTEGRLVGAALAHRTAPGNLLARRAALRRFAAVMHAVHAPPPGWADWLTGDTVVCRCERVPYSRITAAVRDLGATDGRTVKMFARPGMGWCQGRVCGFPTAALAARLCERDVTAADVASFAHRPLALPVTLGQLAGGT